MHILTDNQMRLLREIGNSRLKEDFYLTGGTALAEFYLQHRYSDDLDFFTAMPENIPPLPVELEKIANRAGFNVEIKRTSQFFVEAVFSPGELLTHWATDTPVKLEPLIFSEEANIRYESEFDIGANKISALYDRWAMKDFVDLYFLEKDGYPFNMLFEAAEKKHAGIDKYWMNVALTQITELRNLPRMIKDLSIEDLRSYALGIAERLLGKGNK